MSWDHGRMDLASDMTERSAPREMSRTLRRLPVEDISATAPGIPPVTRYLHIISFIRRSSLLFGVLRDARLSVTERIVSSSTSIARRNPRNPTGDMRMRSSPSSSMSTLSPGAQDMVATTYAPRSGPKSPSIPRASGTNWTSSRTIRVPSGSGWDDESRRFLSRAAVL